MELKPVSSSNIAAIGYDKERQLLRIEFRSGGTYDYYDVPETEFEGLEGAASHGQYFAQHIRGKYRYSRL